MIQGKSANAQPIGKTQHPSRARFGFKEKRHQQSKFQHLRSAFGGGWKSSSRFLVKENPITDGSGGIILNTEPNSNRFGQAPLTRVQLTWIENQTELWIRFGRETEETILDRRRRVLSFVPGSVFAFIRWQANEYGTISSRVDILRAVAAGEPFTTVPFVDPGGELLLHLSGWPKVERVLQAIDAVETIGINAADVAPDYWRHVHNRLTVGAMPRPYTRSRHAAWLLRRRLLP